MVGDSAKDMECARNAGCGHAILVKTGKGELTIEKLAQHPELKDVPVLADLSEAVDYILTGEKR